MADTRQRGAKVDLIDNPSRQVGIVYSYPIAASLGLISGATVGSRYGTNDLVPSTGFIILSNVTSAAFPSNQPAAAQQMQIVSSSALDTSAGAFAQQVEITYLTSPTNPTEPFKKKTEIVTLNGITPVITIATDIFRIDRFHMSRAGANGITAGNISLQNTLGTITFERIDARGTTGETAAHYVERGFRTIITDIDIGVSTAGGVIMIPVMTEIDPSGNHVGIGQSSIELTNAVSPRSLNVPFSTSNPDGKEVFFLMAVKGRASNQQCSGSFSFVDEPI